MAMLHRLKKFNLNLIRYILSGVHLHSSKPVYQQLFSKAIGKLIEFKSNKLLYYKIEFNLILITD